MHEWASRALKEGYWLNTGQAMIVGPGEKGQMLHRDIALWPIFMDGAKNAPEAMVSILLALSDFTEEVGATRVVSGSHLWDDFRRDADPTEYVSAVMPAARRFSISERPCMEPGPTPPSIRGGEACT